jgi:ribonuclease BN (tRNA processing enzyme)
VKVRILGCGTSTGVPKIGNVWGQCDPAEPRNARMRSSILVESAGERVLVDCGPDLRRQLLDAKVGQIDAVIATHDHGDHVHGIDDLRPIAAALGHAVPLYGRAEPTHLHAAISIGRSSNRGNWARSGRSGTQPFASSTSRMAARLRLACASMTAANPPLMRSISAG